MSIEAVAIALHHSRAKGTAKLILVGIANHDGDGGSFPKVATLAKYANVHPRRVTEALNVLGELGEIIIHTQDGGTRGLRDAIRPNRYEFILECPPECDRTKHHRIAGEQIGRSYKGQWTPDKTTKPAGDPVDNWLSGPSDENVPSDENSTRASDENSTSKNHKKEPPLEDSLGAYVTRDAAAVDKQLPPQPAATGRNDAATKTKDVKVPPGLTEEQILANRRGAAIARAALRGEDIKDALEDRKA